MREKKLQYVMFLGMVCLFLSGCSARWHAFAFQPNQIYGSWQFQDKNLGPLTLKFTKDYQFEVDANGDGSRDTWGRFQLHQDRITFIDSQPRITTDCYEPGFHTFQLKKTCLHFYELADQCKPRKHILKQPMVRKKNI